MRKKKKNRNKNKKGGDIKEFSLTLHRPTFPHLKGAVLSAKKSLTARFGMELGVASSL